MAALHRKSARACPALWCITPIGAMSRKAWTVSLQMVESMKSYNVILTRPMRQVLHGSHHIPEKFCLCPVYSSHQLLSGCARFIFNIVFLPIVDTQ